MKLTIIICSSLCLLSHIILKLIGNYLSNDRRAAIEYFLGFSKLQIIAGVLTLIEYTSLALAFILLIIKYV